MKYDFDSFLSVLYAKGVVISFMALCSLLIIIEYASLFNHGNYFNESLKQKEHSLIVNKQDKPAEILNVPLFGIYMPDDLNDDDIKKTMLDLELAGVLLDSDAHQSQVIIRTANGDEKTYKVGDTVPGGAIIKKITTSGVLVEHNGTLERLSLPRKDLNFEPIAKPLKED